MLFSLFGPGFSWTKSRPSAVTREVGGRVVLGLGQSGAP